MNEFYTDYSEYMHRLFPGLKVQKISVNTGNGCPNRDGTLGTGGCIYCNNASFTPAYCFSCQSVAEQIEKGKSFFSRKYKEMKFLAYFQSYTGTYGRDAQALGQIYREALEIKDIVGIVIGTRPDCLDAAQVEMLAGLNRNRPVFVELGVETMHDNTLRIINRGHNSAQSEQAVRMLTDAGIHTGVHLIAGLPGENGMMALQSIKRICATGVESIKLHHLQVLKNTPLEKMMRDGEIEVRPWELEDYLEFCVKVVETVPREIAIERFLASAPPELVVAPKWGIKNHEFTNLLINKLKNRIN